MSNSELNERDLEGVSGGTSLNLERALQGLCPACKYGLDMGYYRCTGSLQDLRQYLQEHGVDSVRHYYECPFHAKA